MKGFSLGMIKEEASKYFCIRIFGIMMFNRSEKDSIRINHGSNWESFGSNDVAILIRGTVY